MAGRAPIPDPVSRRTLRWFALKLACTTATAAAAASFGASPAACFLATFQALCFRMSVLGTTFALAVREQARSDRLGFRDEALAFGGLALLAHAARGLLGP